MLLVMPNAISDGACAAAQPTLAGSSSNDSTRMLHLITAILADLRIKFNSRGRRSLIGCARSRAAPEGVARFFHPDMLDARRRL